MEFEIQRSTLLSALEFVSLVTGNKASAKIYGMSGLSSVVLTAKDTKLYLHATNLSLWASATAPASIKTEGTAAVGAARFLSVIKSLPEDAVHIHATDTGVAVTSGKSRFRLEVFAVGDIPLAPLSTGGVVIPLHGDALASTLEKTSFCVSRDEGRPLLCGVFWNAADGALTAATSDGCRLAVYSQSSATNGSQISAIIPSDACQILKMFKGEEVSLSLNDRIMHVRGSSGREVSLRAIDGAYPDYRAIIPKESTIVLKLPRKEFAASVERTALCCDERSGSVSLALKPGEVAISAATSGLGEAYDSIPIEYTGAEFTIRFNPKFLAEALKHITDDVMEIGLSTPFSTAVLKGASSPNGGLYLLSPMRA